MATLHDAVKTRIESLTAFTTIMTGGGFKSDDIDTLDGGGWEWAKNNSLVVSNKLVHHWIMRWGDSTPHQANFPVLSAEKESLDVFLYAPLGDYASLDLAMTALKNGLHNTLFENLDDRALARCLCVLLSREVPAEEYMMSPSRFAKFEFTQIR